MFPSKLIEFSIEQFKKLLDTPDYYGPSEIEKNIITPVLKELPPFFKNLKIKKVKANTRGTPVKSYIFTFTPEQTGKWIEGKYDNADKWFENHLGDEEVKPVPMHDWLKDEK